MNRRESSTRLAGAVVLASLALAACRTAVDTHPAPPLLNSERIEQRYGSYGVEVLQQRGPLRVTCLYSLEPAGRICRTVAVTLFDATPPALSRESAAIRYGASIGATLKAAGWSVVKHDHLLTERAAGREFANLLHWPPGDELPEVAIDAYALWVERPGESYRFALIAEAHHPDYLDRAELRRLYPEALAKASGEYRELLGEMDAVLSDGVESP